MDDCPYYNQGVLKKIGCILTYGGCWKEIGINYSLTGISIFAAWKQLQILQITTTTSPHHNLPSRNLLVLPSSSSARAPAAAALGFSVCFQIGLCLILDCSGISIVWCSIAGWMIMHGRYHYRVVRTTISTQRNNQDNDASTSTSSTIVQKLALCLDGIAIIYYMLVSEPIVTVAHGCAVIMGALLFRLSNIKTTTTTSSDNDDDDDDDDNFGQDNTSPSVGQPGQREALLEESSRAILLEGNSTKSKDL